MIFLDTNIFMYAAGIQHPHKGPCIKLLQKIAKAGAAHEYCTNTEVLQEILHRFHALKRLNDGLKLFDAVINLGLVIHPVELADLVLARKILTQYSSPPAKATISARDAVHLGVAQRRNIEIIVSYDQGLLACQEFRVIAP